MLVIHRFLYFIFILKSLAFAQSDDSAFLADLTIDLPVRQIQFSAQTGTTLQCDLQRDHKTPSIFSNVRWLVYSFLEQRFVQLDDNTELIKQVNTINENYLSFLPFTSDQYNANLHNNFFRCVRTSPANKYRIAGQVIRMKALVSRTVEVHVYDQQTPIGDNAALLRCVYPVELRSYVRVSGWLSDDGLIILPLATSTADPYLLVQRRYNVLSTGELLISNVNERDANRRFRCQVINILTGERFESASWSRLTLTVRNTKPGLPQLNIADSTLAQPKSSFLVKPGDTLLLACLFTSHPTPTVTWQQQHGIDTSPNRSSTNRTFTKIYQANTGNLLLLPSVTLEDIGHYVCTANNSFGHARLELQLKLQTDLHIELTSSSPDAQLDKSITLNCSYVYTGDKYKVIWYKNMEQVQIDGLEITSGQYETEKMEEYSTLITHWLKIRSFRYTDSGVYQCFLRSISLQQQRFPVLSAITYNRPISNLQSTTASESNKDQLSNAIYLIVKEQEPKFISTFNEQLKLPSNELSLKCIAIGIPLPEIQFHINGFSFINSPRIHIETAQLDSQTMTSQLNISSLTVSDSAFYECVAKNELGSISNEARINVMGSPGINLHLLSPSNHQSNLNLSAVVGGSFSIRCPFYGYPFEKITFYKNEKKILSDERRQERVPGRLIIHSIRKDDEGDYKCIVTSVTGEKNEANMYLKVLSAPIISAFDFPSNLEEDMRTSIICSVTSGDSPVTMSWLRNNQLISNSDQNSISNLNQENKLQFQIVPLNQFVSSLLINKLTPEYTANYTCTASNSVGSANHSAFLQVRSRTRFGLKPLARQVAIIGEPVRFDCQAIGYPQPVIRWKYLGSSSLLDNHALIQLYDTKDKIDFSNANSAYLANSNVQSVSILSNPRVHVLENGSLIIKQVQSEDEGSYLCEASNSIGKPVEACAQLLVFQAPRVKLSFDLTKTTNGHSNRLSVLNYNSMANNLNTISVKKGNQASFTCSAMGTQPNNVEWTHNGVLLPNTNTENIAISNSYTKDLICGFYVGYRMSGSEETFNFITVPTDEQIVIESSNGKEFSDHLTFNYTLDQLRKSTKYTFVVQAFNSEGAGPYSNEVFANTFNNDPPKPIHIRIENLSHHNVTIVWKKLTDPNQVQGFVLNYKQMIDNELDQQMFNSNPDQWETIKLPKFYRKYTLTNLNCGTKYLVHMIAYNEIGESEPSNELNFSTKGNLPIAPSRLTFIQPNITSALLYLNAWKDGDCLLSHFQIQYKQKNEFQWKFHSTIQVTNALTNNLPIYPSSGQHFRTEYHITGSNELPNQIKANNIYQSNSIQSTPSITMASTYGQLVINDLQPGTWHDVQVEAYNQAGKTSTNYVFSTLTLDGATVSPLVLDDQLNVAINSDFFYLNFLLQYSSFTFVLVVFTLLVIISVYLVYVRAKLQQSTIDQFSRHHQDTVSLNSYSNNKICSALNAIKSPADIYDTRHNLENGGPETCDNCDQTTVYYPSSYPSIYATDPTTICRLAAQQIVPNFLSTNNLTSNKTTENNYQDANDSIGMVGGALTSTMSNSLGALLNANTISSSNCIHLNNHQTEYDFVDPTVNNFCTNKNCSISNVLNKTEQLNTNLMNSKVINCMNSNQQTSTNTNPIDRSSHVYDIPHRQQQALNELQKLKQMSTFKNVDLF